MPQRMGRQRRRRLPRLLLNAATAISIPALVVAVAALFLSDRPGDQPWQLHHGSDLNTWTTLVVARTQVEVARYAPYGQGLPPALPPYGCFGVHVNWDVAGFKFDNSGLLISTSAAPGAPMYTYAGFEAVIPLWFVIATAATCPAISLQRLLRRRRHHPGHCPTCGYDLRATPDRCPECGTIAAQ